MQLGGDGGMAMKYKWLEDGDLWYYDSDMQVACCSCGLAHDVKLEKDGLRFYRNERSTAQIRRHGQFGLAKGEGEWRMTRS